MKKTVLILVVMLFSACSQKSPTIDGQNSKFEFKFYPVKSDIVGEKFPLLFLFEGYYGKWAHPSIAEKFQSLGYNTVTVGFFTNEGLSNNLSRVNLNDIKKRMDAYKGYSSIDTNAIGVIGRGKGGELALLLASLYPEFKMVVGMTAAHVVFQASDINLAHHSSWVLDGKELDFVPYTLLSTTTVKSVFNLMTQITSTSFRDIHIEALENSEAVEKARIKVEDINGSIFLISSSNDTWLPSTMMAKEIVKTLKENKFAHHYEHKDYNTTNYLHSHGDEWDDTYRFVLKSLKSKVLINAFKKVDINNNKSVSLEEYIVYVEEEEKKKRRAFMTKMFSKCDTNHDYKIAYSEARMSIDYKNDSYYNSDVINPNYVPLPSVNPVCRVSQDNFKEYDLDADKSVSFNEFFRGLKTRRTQHLVDNEVINTIKKQNIINDAKIRFVQCDENNDSKIDKIESNSKTCKINTFIFTLADSNLNNFISFDELFALPTKYAHFRQPFYIPLTGDKAVVYIYAPKAPNFYYSLLNSIDECDINHDVKLDKSEATAKECGFTEEEFLEADVNKDGQFEYKDIELTDKIKFFHKVDEDNNEKLDFDEWIKVY